MPLFVLIGLHAALLVLIGCGDPIENHIAAVMEGGEAREEALLELLFAKRYPVPPLLAALDSELELVG